MKLDKIIETFVYGILSALFMAAFFFGMMYPEYGFAEPDFPQTTCVSADMTYFEDEMNDTAGTIRVQQENDKAGSGTNRRNNSKNQTEYMGSVDCVNEINRLRRMRSADKIVYTSYFYECLKKKS